MNNTIRILSTKKLKPAQQELLLNKGFKLVQADFIKVDFLEVDTAQIHPTIIITSQNGVRSLVKNNLVDFLKEHKFLCVGEKTTVKLKELGLQVANTFNNAKSLGEYIVTKEEGKAFTYFCGNIRRKELPNLLDDNKVVFNEIVAYKTLFTPQQMKGKYDGVLFFSPSLVESYCFNNALENTTAFCIGETTAKAAKVYTNALVIANKPTVENVILQVVNYFTNKPVKH